MKKNKNQMFVLSIFTGIFIGIFSKLFIIDFLHISGTSMEPTLKNSSIIFVNKLAYGLVKPFSGNFIIQWNTPKANDIVIFLHNDKIVVKRCVAVSEEYLDFSSNPQYSLKVGGKIISLTNEEFSKLNIDGRVPKGYILALGDNTEKSVDSRSYGFISEKNVIGKIIGK